MDQIVQVLEFIESRLAELESEKNELGEYQRLDKERRAIDYALHSKQLTDATRKFENVKKRGDFLAFSFLFLQEGKHLFLECG